MSEKRFSSLIHQLLLLDESGSMSSIRRSTISAFNELMSHNSNLLAEYPEQERRLSFFTFNGKGVRTDCFDTPMDESITINEETYNPSDNTLLFDAIGSSILKVKHQVNGKEHHSILETIIFRWHGECFHRV